MLQNIDINSSNKKNINDAKTTKNRSKDINNQVMVNTNTSKTRNSKEFSSRSDAKVTLRANPLMMNKDTTNSDAKVT